MAGTSRVGKIGLALLWTALALAAPANAQDETEPVSGFFGNVVADPPVVSKGAAVRPATTTVNVAFDNTASAVNFGISSTDLTAEWGDELFLATSGMLSEHRFTIFNANTSAGNLLTAQVRVEFRDKLTNDLLGSYTTSVNFGAGLPAGFSAVVTAAELDPLAIILDVTDVIVIQSVLAKTGPANRIGVASRDPIAVGTSPATMYVHASTHGGGVAGFYSFGSPAHPGYQVALTTPPVPTAKHSWSEVKRLYR